VPQNKWDGTWSKNTQEHGCLETHTQVRIGSHLKASDVERKHLEGRGGEIRKRNKGHRDTEVCIKHTHVISQLTHGQISALI